MSQHTRTPTALGVAAFLADLRRHAKALADRAKLRDLMTQACALRAASEVTAAELDKAAATFCRATLAVSMMEARHEC